MGVATYHLDNSVLVAIQCFIIDAMGVHFTEAKFTSLGDEAAAVVGVMLVILFLVLIAGRRTVDHHTGALDRLLRFIKWRNAEIAELSPMFLLDAKFCAMADQRGHLGTVGHQWRALVKSDFIDAKRFAKTRQQTNQRFADGSGADYMDDVLMHSVLLLPGDFFCVRFSTERHCAMRSDGHPAIAIRDRPPHRTVL